MREKVLGLKDEFLHRKYECILSSENCVHFLQSSALCKGNIKANYTLETIMGGDFLKQPVKGWKMFFKLQFDSVENLEKFHSLGFQTQQDEMIYYVNTI